MKVAAISAGHSPVVEPGLQPLVAKSVSAGTLHASVRPQTLLGKGYEVRIYDPSLDPSSLVGTNRQYVESRLPHLKRILTAGPEEALQGADISIVSHATQKVAAALPASPPERIIDLFGRLGPEIEALECYEGFAW